MADDTEQLIGLVSSGSKVSQPGRMGQWCTLVGQRGCISDEQGFRPSAKQHISTHMEACIFISSSFLFLASFWLGHTVTIRVPLTLQGRPWKFSCVPRSLSASLSVLSYAGPKSLNSFLDMYLRLWFAAKQSFEPPCLNCTTVIVKHQIPLWFHNDENFLPQTISSTSFTSILTAFSLRGVLSTAGMSSQSVTAMPGPTLPNLRTITGADIYKVRLWSSIDFT